MSPAALSAMMWADKRDASPGTQPLMPGAGLAAVLFLVLWVAPVVLYAPLLDNGWNQEDLPYVWESRVHHPMDIPRLFTFDVFKMWQQRHYTYDAYAGGSVYRPVGYLYFAALHAFFGLDAMPYRVVNLFIYSLGSFLVLIFVHRLTQHPTLAWLTAGLFAVEYARVEYLGLVAFQGGLVLVFYLASAIGYLAARTASHQDTRRRWYGVSLLAAFGACFDYELGISLPLVLLLLEWFGGTIRTQWLFQPAWVLPHGLIALFYVLIRTVVESQFHPDTVTLALTNPHDLLYAGINMVSRLIMLIFPAFPGLRQQVKTWVFGDASRQSILAAHPGLVIVAGGLLVGTAVLVVWLGTRPSVRRFLGHDIRGQWCVLSCGWIVLALTPTAVFYGLGSRHLMIAAIAANLLKALGIVAVSNWCRRWWIASSLLALLVLSSLYFIAPEVETAERHDRLNRTVVADAVRLIREAAVDDRPMIVYFLNGIAENDLAEGLQEVVQAALGRENIRLVMPYVRTRPQSPADAFRTAPQVTIRHDEISVADNIRTPEWIGVVHYDLSVVQAGRQIRNGGLYTLEVLEVDDVRHNLLRFVIRYGRPPGTRMLFLKFEDGRLVRQDPPPPGAEAPP